ncbi:uncharacterized protein M6B38_374135 [Iris pallida]|uniref:Transposase MuDR plant domain-containing protein n=1 Tax=Iris pallida TaxID=29817 RepID=A0AAX6GCZ6_IRIPA|nr:uncharacterized protein M6B38_374135 [Iris pallida]
MDGYLKMFVNYRRKIYTILRVCPDTYNHMDMVSDCIEVTKAKTALYNCVIQLFGFIPGQLTPMSIEHDADMLDFFGFNINAGKKSVTVELQLLSSGHISSHTPPEPEPTYECNGYEGDDNNVNPNDPDDINMWTDDEDDADWNEAMSDDRNSEIAMSGSDDGGLDDGFMSDHHSNDGNSEGLFGSEGDELSRKLGRTTGLKPFRRQVDGSIVLEKGHEFGSLPYFREILRDYSIQEGFKLVRIKNGKDRVTAICGFVGCPWRIHCPPVGKSCTYRIKVLGLTG